MLYLDLPPCQDCSLSVPQHTWSYSYKLVDYKVVLPSWPPVFSLRLLASQVLLLLMLHCHCISQCGELGFEYSCFFSSVLSYQLHAPLNISCSSWGQKVTFLGPEQSAVGVRRCELIIRQVDVFRCRDADYFPVQSMFCPPRIVGYSANADMWRAMSVCLNVMSIN